MDSRLDYVCHHWVASCNVLNASCFELLPPPCCRHPPPCCLPSLFIWAHQAMLHLCRQGRRQGQAPQGAGHVQFCVASCLEAWPCPLTFTYGSNPRVFPLLSIRHQQRRARTTTTTTRLSWQRRRCLHRQQAAAIACWKHCHFPELAPSTAHWLVVLSLSHPAGGGGCPEEGQGGNAERQEEVN